MCKVITERRELDKLLNAQFWILSKKTKGKDDYDYEND
jgi:hypothetical protein